MRGGVTNRARLTNSWSHNVVVRGERIEVIIVIVLCFNIMCEALKRIRVVMSVSRMKVREEKCGRGGRVYVGGLRKLPER
jgi:hypothetical protein